MEKIYRSVLISIYMLVGYYTNIRYTSNTIVELFVGLIISMLFMNILESIGYHIAYSFVGNNKWLYGNSTERSIGHWVIRVAWSIIILLLSFTPLFAWLLNPVIRNVSGVLIEYFNNIMSELVTVLSP